MRKFLYILFLVFALSSTQRVYSQNVAICDTVYSADSSAILDIVASDRGMLLPSHNLSDTLLANPLTNPANGILIFNNSTTSGLKEAFYLWEDSEWDYLFAFDSIDWKLSGNTGSLNGTSYLGTDDNQNFSISVFDTLRFTVDTLGRIIPHRTGHSIFIGDNSGKNDNLTDNFNVYIGKKTGYSNATDYNIIAIGNESNYSSVESNIGIGHLTLQDNYDANNIAFGNNALQYNFGGEANIAIGMNAANYDTHGDVNIAIGTNAKYENSSSFNTIAIGHYSQYRNGYGFNDLSIGNSSLYYQQDNDYWFYDENPANIAIGDSALYLVNINAEFSLFNIAIGQYSQFFNFDGAKNTSIGYSSLNANIVFDNSVCVGFNSIGGDFPNIYSGYAYNTTAIGTNSCKLTGDENSTTCGCSTETAGSFNTNIGGNSMKLSSRCDSCTALGYYTLFFIDSDSGHASNNNTTIGFRSMIGSSFWPADCFRHKNNTATGSNTIACNDTWNSENNSAFGNYSLFNIDSYYNTCLGSNSGYKLADSESNTLIGTGELIDHDTISYNTIISNSSYALDNDGNSILEFQQPSYTMLYPEEFGKTKIATTKAMPVQSSLTKLSDLKIDNLGVYGNSFVTKKMLLKIGRYNTIHDLDSVSTKNLSIGYYALLHNDQFSDFEWEQLINSGTNLQTQDYLNTAIGNYSQYADTAGKRNTSIGYETLKNNIAGNDNICFGNNSMWSNTYSSGNIAIGQDAIYTMSYSNSNIEWYTGNTAIGIYSMYTLNPTNNGNGMYNTACGYETMRYITNGEKNTAIGYNSSKGIITADANTSFGSSALISNSTGAANVSIGSNSMISNVSGKYNVGISHYALRLQQKGNENVAIGYASLHNINEGEANTVVGGASAMSIKDSTDLSTYIGFYSGPSSSTTEYNYSTAIGYYANTTASHQIRFGNGSSNPATSIGGPVTWTTVSDGRFKDNVQENVHGIEFVMKLRPVTYNYNHESLNDFLNVPDSCRDRNNSALQYQTIRTGFIAQEVEQAAKDCNYTFSGVDKPNNENDYYSLRYAEFVVPLVKSVQEQQDIIDNNQRMIDSNQELLNELKKQNELYLEFLEEYENK